MTKISALRMLTVVATVFMFVFTMVPTILGAGATLQIKGSDTMVNLMSNLAEAYMKARPDVQIAVTGGGSGTGIAALMNGTTDLCASSRDLKDNERKLAAQKKVSPQSVIIGLDGLAVMVHPQNPVAELSLEQLRKIYTGEYLKWSDVGGPDQPIIVLSRESNSGTYVYFQEHVLNKADYSPRVRLMTSTAAIAMAVTDDQWSIGYGGVAYTEHANVKTVKIKSTPDGVAVAPSEAAVHDGSYPISRPLFLITNGAPGGSTKEFIDYCLSDDGQKIVTETGYMTVVK